MEKDTLKEAKELAQKAKEKYKDRPDVQVEIISLHKAFYPPEGWEPRKTGHRFWCPYCHTERLFYYYKRWGTYRCPVCGISDRDYHVRRINKLWTREMLQLEKSRRKKS